MMSDAFPFHGTILLHPKTEDQHETMSSRRNNIKPLPTRQFLVLLLVMLGITYKFPSVFPSLNNNGSQGMVQALSSTSCPLRILCFGDSLTAGTSPPHLEEYPYAPHLEKALQSTFPNRSVMVRQMGFPGWTAKQLLESSTDARGLQSLIRRVQDPTLELVIVLAGTNDLGYNFGAQEIIESVQALHQVCHAEKTRTIAIAVPPSQHQNMNPEFAAKARQVNQGLEEYCQHCAPNWSKFVAFPFEWAPNDDRWSPDGLHFSAKGYQVLGESLVPAVKEMILLRSQQQQEASDT